MKYNDIVVGMRVVPHSKSVGHISFNNCYEWEKAKKEKQPYLYVTGKQDYNSFLNMNNIIILANTDKYLDSGGYFSAEDFELYIEGDVNIKYKKEDLNSCMLFKLRDQGLCVLLDDKVNSKIFYCKKFIEKGIGSVSTLKDHYDNNLKAYFWEDYYSGYDIIAIKQYDSCNKVLHMVLNDKEPEEWDWVRVEKSKQEIELENLIEKLNGQLTDAQKQLDKIKNK